MPASEADRILAEAVAAKSAGRHDMAEARFRDVLLIAPEHAGALNALGMYAMRRGEARSAADLFSQATAADPSAPALWLNLAGAQRALGDDDAEKASLEALLRLDQRDLAGLIRIAQLYERLGQREEATKAWSGVSAVGGAMEAWPADLEDILSHAADYVRESTQRFDELIEQEIGADLEALPARDRRRASACLDFMAGRRSIFINQCEGVHYPFLPADEFFDREHFPWLPSVEAQTGPIRSELKAVLESKPEALYPYVQLDPGTPANKWSPLDGSLEWSALHLWREGERIDEVCRHFPLTLSVVEQLALANISGRAPSVFFSVLKAGGRIPPHTGVTNTRTIIHLPLIVPDGCGFRVGGETRAWREGEAFAFDDTIEHEAWNKSSEDRVVLIFDVWNPHLSEEERRLLQKVFVVADQARGPGAVSSDLPSRD